MPEEWEKVLWKKQTYPDNYVPPSFLSSLRKNPNFKPYTYAPLVLDSCAVVQHLASIFIFVAVFVRLKEDHLDARALVWGSVGAFVTGYATWELLGWYTQDAGWVPKNRAKTVKSATLVFLSLMALSPVLRTLSAATSSDSIWALSASLFGLNALLADYTPAHLGTEVHERLTSVLSMNAAISASVVLASRLSDDLSVFALVLYAVQLFALYPLLRRRIQAVSAIIHALLALILSAGAIYYTAPLSATASVIYAAVLIFIIFVAPGVLVWAQRFKNEIRGPWDVAVPKVN